MLKDGLGREIEVADDCIDTRADFHRERALQELDAGLRSGSTAAVRAHLQLSALHMQKAPTLSDDKSRPLPSM